MRANSLSGVRTVEHPEQLVVCSAHHSAVQVQHMQVEHLDQFGAHRQSHIELQTCQRQHMRTDSLEIAIA